jgi:predicted enzyme related to lactoylglutathione lyase
MEEQMDSLRPHLALTVADVEQAIPFYEALFGTAPSKVKPGYAKFEPSDPALNFTLNQGERAGLGAFNHGGIQVASTDEVLATRLRLQGAGLEVADELDTTCCYAHQDKIWVTAPDGESWEVFVTHGDAEQPAREASEGGIEPCCGAA